jgi:hypothetical protein
VRLRRIAPARATIALLESDRPDAPRAGDAYGDISITPPAGAVRSDCHDLDRQGQPSRAVAFPLTRAPH